jgi:hypothetical protein
MSSDLNEKRALGASSGYGQVLVKQRSAVK